MNQLNKKYLIEQVNKSVLIICKHLFWEAEVIYDNNTKEQ